LLGSCGVLGGGVKRGGPVWDAPNAEKQVKYLATRKDILRGGEGKPMTFQRRI